MTQRPDSSSRSTPGTGGARRYYDAEGDTSRLRGRRVALLGFGRQGQAHALKLRDSGFDRLILLVSDTANNRRMLEAYREDLRSSFPLDTRAVLADLRRGRTPSASGIVVL